MALAQGLHLVSGTAEICLALRKIVGHRPGILHVLDAFPVKGVGAVSRQGRPRRGLVP